MDRWRGWFTLPPHDTQQVAAVGPPAQYKSPLGDIHHRQPSIVEAVDFDEWLAPDTPQDRLLALARHSTEGPFDCWPVSKRVNYPRNDDPDLLSPVAS